MNRVAALLQKAKEVREQSVEWESRLAQAKEELKGIQVRVEKLKALGSAIEAEDQAFLDSQR